MQLYITIHPVLQQRHYHLLLCTYFIDIKLGQFLAVLCLYSMASSKQLQTAIWQSSSVSSFITSSTSARNSLTRLVQLVNRWWLFVHVFLVLHKSVHLKQDVGMKKFENQASKYDHGALACKWESKSGKSLFMVVFLVLQFWYFFLPFTFIPLSATLVNGHPLFLLQFSNTRLLNLIMAQYRFQIFSIARKVFSLSQSIILTFFPYPHCLAILKPLKYSPSCSLSRCFNLYYLFLSLSLFPLVLFPNIRFTKILTGAMINGVISFYANNVPFRT